jgi:hypothetical protein
MALCDNEGDAEVVDDVIDAPALDDTQLGQRESVKGVRRRARKSRGCEHISRLRLERSASRTGTEPPPGERLDMGRRGNPLDSQLDLHPAGLGKGLVALRLGRLRQAGDASHDERRVLSDPGCADDRAAAEGR